MCHTTPSLSNAPLGAEPGKVVAVVLPQAKFDPHGTLRLASGHYRAAFETIGFRTLTVDLDQFGPAEMQALCAAPLHAVFSDGGWVNRVMVENHDGVQPLTERLGVPVIALINDSPCSAWMNLVIGRDCPGQITAFLDPDFSTLWQRWVPQRGVHCIYVPACPPMSDPPPDNKRDIAVLTASTFRAPEGLRMVLHHRFSDSSLIRLYNAIVEIGLAEALAPYSAVCDAACDALDIRLDLTIPEHRFLLYLANLHIRNERRRRMVDRLADRPITLVGCADGLRLHPDSRVLPPVPYAALMALYRRSRIVVTSPPYSGGISERLTHPIAAGALVVAPPTTLSDQLLGRDRVFVTVADDFADLNDGLELAAEPDIRHRIYAAAQTEVVKRFTPEATVRSLLKIIGMSAATGDRS